MRSNLFHFLFSCSDMLQVYAEVMTNYYEGLTMQTIMTSLTMKCIFPLSLFWGKKGGGTLLILLRNFKKLKLRSWHPVPSLHGKLMGKKWKQ